ncbi:hypothetical protein [Nocardia salmonicida]
MDELDAAEPVAAGFFRQLMHRAEGVGLGEEDYEAPIGFRVTYKNKPWIAEFKTEDSGQKQDVRLYWGEAPVEQQSLVACLIGLKRRGLRLDLVRQDKHIVGAMGVLQRWCNKSGYTCRKL